MKVLAILDPTRSEQLALHRALTLTEDIDADLHLFCCSHLAEEQMGEYSSRKEAKLSEMERIRNWIDDLADTLRSEQKIRITTETCWNELWYKAAVNAAARNGANFIVKSSFEHHAGTRLLSNTSDYYLIRYASCPVLLAHNEENWINGRILAAIALDKPDADHELLNNAIVTAAQQMARKSGSELHIVSALAEEMMLVMGDNEEEEDDVEDSVLSSAKIISSTFGVPVNQVHIRHNDPSEAILKTAAEVGADLVIIGSIARKGLTGALIGNTAEKVLDQLPMDVMTIS